MFDRYTMSIQYSTGWLGNGSVPDSFSHGALILIMVTPRVHNININLYYVLL